MDDADRAGQFQYLSLDAVQAGRPGKPPVRAGTTFWFQGRLYEACVIVDGVTVHAAEIGR